MATGVRMTSQPQHATHPSAAPTREVARLEGLLERQLGLYGQLDALSQQQRRHIETDDSEALLDVLRQREALVETILSLNTELEPLLARWSARLADADRGDLARRVESVQALAQRVAERDEADRDTLQSRRDGVADQLASIGKRRGAVRAYGGGPGGSGPRYQDREG